MEIMFGKLGRHSWWTIFGGYNGCIGAEYDESATSPTLVDS